MSCEALREIFAPELQEATERGIELGRNGMVMNCVALYKDGKLEIDSLKLITGLSDEEIDKLV